MFTIQDHSDSRLAAPYRGSRGCSRYPTAIVRLLEPMIARCPRVVHGRAVDDVDQRGEE
jgi:hypothetical protein